VSHLVFVGERRSRRARAMGVSWSDGRLAACTLHAALRACGIDPTTVTFVNLFQDRDDRWALEPEVLVQVLQLAATGATIVALGQRVHRAFERAQLEHLPRRSSRGTWPHSRPGPLPGPRCGSGSADPVLASLSEVSTNPYEEILHAWTQSTHYDAERPGVLHRE
jgi:hypothetical protein